MPPHLHNSQISSTHVFISPVLSSCLNHESNTLYRWKLDSFEGTGVCAFTLDSVKKEHKLIETFLGLNDSTYSQTALLLLDGDDFNIIEDQKVCLTGKWQMTESTLLLNTNIESWKLEIIKQNTDSLVLKTDAYPHIIDLQIILKH